MRPRGARDTACAPRARECSLLLIPPAHGSAVVLLHPPLQGSETKREHHALGVMRRGAASSRHQHCAARPCVFAWCGALAVVEHLLLLSAAAANMYVARRHA